MSFCSSHLLSLSIPLSSLRSVRSCLLDLALERAAGWRNEEEEERGCKVRPYAQSTPTPAAFSQDTPTHSVNGQRVIQPVPVSSAGKAPTTPSTPATHHLQQISHQSPATPYTQPHPSMLSSSSLSLLHSSHNLPQSQTSLPPTSGTPTPFQAGLHHHVTLPPLTANQQANSEHYLLLLPVLLYILRCFISPSFYLTVFLSRPLSLNLLFLSLSLLYIHLQYTNFLRRTRGSFLHRGGSNAACAWSLSPHRLLQECHVQCRLRGGHMTLT